MGLRLQIDQSTLIPEVRRACKEFAAFLRREYFFHYELLYMLKTKLRLLLWMVIEYMEHLHGWEMIMRYHHIIRVAAGDYQDKCKRWGKDMCINSNITYDST